MEHGALRIALPQATMEADTRAGAVRRDDAQSGAIAEDVEEPNKFLRDTHVA